MLYIGRRKMDIRITPKTKISISELALDEHVPSVNVAIEIEARAGIFSLIRFDCWFECSFIDIFFYHKTREKSFSK